MVHTTLIDAVALAAHLSDPAWAVVDCRFRLDDPAWGEADYARAHVPGAAYAHLDRDLSGPKSGRNGRHPLPDPTRLPATFERLGIGRGTQVVAYDQDNAMYASRLWWLLRWMGHTAVAVLDGGFAAWTREGRPVEAGMSTPAPRRFEGRSHAVPAVDSEAVAAISTGRAPGLLLDARAPERFRGEVEPIDRVPGHIPGAANRFFQRNLAEDGRFLPADTLRTEFESLLGGAAPGAVVAYCGSGVTACHNLLALEHAGLPGARLYAGSWSEWSSDPDRPVARGDGTPVKA